MISLLFFVPLANYSKLSNTTRMKRISFTLVLTLLCSAALTAGESGRKITLEAAFSSRTFTPDKNNGLRSIKEGIHYTAMEESRILQYSYHTGEAVEVLFDASVFPEIRYITDYHLNDTENKILIETGHEQIYRHSYRADYWVYDRVEETLKPVSGKGKQQLGTFSPDGSRVAFVRDNNLFVTDLEKELQVTMDGKRNYIINGAPDWVYEEEFGFSQGFCWSPDGKRIAFYRFDESRVKQFHMTMFGELYPESYEFKYPKAGEDNSLVSIHVYDLESGKTRTMDVGAESDQYIPRIKWTTDPNTLSIMRLNRLQNQLDILHADATTGKSEVVYREVNECYISEASDETVTYLEDGEHFILNSERDGYFHLYLYNFRNGDITAITSGDYDVSDFIDYDADKKTLYYASYEESSIEQHIYSIKLDGSKKKKISTRPGTNRATFSSTFRYHIMNNSTANSPYHITLHDQKGKEIRVLVDNARLKQTMEEYGFAQTEFLTVNTEGGQELNAYMIKPGDFDPSKQYPLFVYVYGGPESQNVINAWGHRNTWFQMLVQQGYIVACVDNRGTNGRGEAFRKATYMKLGELETIDQLEAARWFGKQDYIDQDRMGIFGWSYGGYMTSLCMTKGEGTFKMGIAVGPVTTWRFYDHVYSERFMRTPRENPEGYDENSPINFANGLQGKFLLIHGSGDDNVHFQNTMDFTEALVQANKQFELQIYPNKAHGIRGGNTSLHLYTRMTDFILENL